MMATVFRPQIMGGPGEEDSSVSSSSSSNSSCSSCMDSSPPTTTTINDAAHLLMLEGDVLAVSHDGIARTCYHLTTTTNTGSAATSRSSIVFKRRPPPSLAIEEQYDLQRACKTFLVREMDESGSSSVTSSMGDQDVMVLRQQTSGLLAPMAPMGRLLGSVKIQEIDQGDCPLFEALPDGTGDHTGGSTWEASIAMALFFTAHEPSLLSGRIIELGCGVGMGGILTQMGPLLQQQQLQQQQVTTENNAPSNTITSVTLTDGNEQVLKQCRHNVQTALASLTMATSSCENVKKTIPPVFVKHLDWNNIPDADQHIYNVVIACDVAYLYTDVEPLGNALEKLLVAQKNNGHGQIHLFAPYNRGALQQLCVYLRQTLDLHVVVDAVEMDRYRLKAQNSSNYNKSNTIINSFSSSSSDQQWWKDHPEMIKTDDDDTILGPAVEDYRAYASKSTAKFLHITATRKEKNCSKNQNAHESSLEDID